MITYPLLRQLFWIGDTMSEYRAIDKLRQHFHERASNPPVNCAPNSREWQEYTDEMRGIEEDLRELGEVF